MSLPMGRRRPRFGKYGNRFLDLRIPLAKYYGCLILKTCFIQIYLFRRY